MAIYPEFKGKVAIVTGAGRINGLGFATAKRFAQEGADVAITDAASGNKIAGLSVASQDQLREAEVELKNFAPERRIAAFVCDQRDPEQIKTMVSAVKAQLGRIDYLANVASICPIGLAPYVSVDTWDETMDVNARGQFLLAQEVAKVIIEQGWGGRIVNVSAPGAKMGWPSASVYSASKAAIIAFTRCFAKDLAKHKILVNSICPGTMHTTEMGRQATEDLAKVTGVAAEVYRKRTLEQATLGRIEMPEEAASLIIFLCSDDSTYITGQSINVDGGLCPY